MKRVKFFLFIAAILVSSLVMAAERNDSAVFLLDVSETCSGKKMIDETKRISQSMNQKFPSYVKSAGAEEFGNLHIPQVDWIFPVKDYDKSGLDGALSKLQKGLGATPMGYAIHQLPAGLDKAQGKKALIIISDGRDNGVACPVKEVKALKQKYSDNLCVYTIQLGKNAEGGKLLDALVKEGGCGKASKASDLNSDSAIQGLVDVIFPPDKAAPPPPPPPPPAKPEEPKCVTDSDKDGVNDCLDKCPDTPKGVKVDERGCWVFKGEQFLFAFDSSKLEPKYASLLDDSVKILQDNPDLKVLIEGHTDSVGTKEYNQKLSVRRAEAVRAHLVSKGIDKKRLDVKGFGLTKPIASNKTKEGRAQNRRVEFTVVK
jgi:OmpA-OmpF porin, OOP family